ncbi:MAG: hypothetical protein HQM13_07625 [SAR324 cluster bacterium]|nr:hypothetical protein [SAR324 cluster bacterium]
MNKFEVDNNSYFIFDKDSSEHMVCFLWGKFDFRMYFRKAVSEETAKKPKISFTDENGNYYIADRLQHQRHGEWYDFQKVTSHGFTFEETLWQHGEKVYYAEFPKELFVVAAEVSSQELGLKPAH